MFICLYVYQVGTDVRRGLMIDGSVNRAGLNTGQGPRPGESQCRARPNECIVCYCFMIIVCVSMIM